MKKFLAVLFVLTMFLSACDEKTPDILSGNIDPKVSVNDKVPVADEEKLVTNVSSVSETFYNRTISLVIPEGWNALKISDDIFDLQHIGIQLFDGEIPEQREMYDGKLFVAIAASGHATYYVDDYSTLGTEFTEEAYTTKSGYAMTLYYVDGLPDYATFDDYPEMCVFFDLSENDDLDEIFGIIDSIVTEESKPTVEEETLPVDSGPVQSDAAEPVNNNTDAEPVNDTAMENAEFIKAYWQWRNELYDKPDGKEVTIFADNTFDCDYEGYKKISYDLDDLRPSIMAPEGWNAFRFYPICDYNCEQFENGLTGIPIYDGELPVKIRRTWEGVEHDDYTDFFANMPMEKSTFFFAESPWQDPREFLANVITKFDHETYTDKRGRTMQVYFIDGLPKYAVYDDFFNFCIWFNVETADEIPTIVNMVNSVDVTLTNDAKFVLNTAERLGYTVIPPEGIEDDE